MKMKNVSDRRMWSIFLLKHQNEVEWRMGRALRFLGNDFRLGLRGILTRTPPPPPPSAPVPVSLARWHRAAVSDTLKH